MFIVPRKKCCPKLYESMWFLLLKEIDMSKMYVRKIFNLIISKDKRKVKNSQKKINRKINGLIHIKIKIKIKENSKKKTLKKKN